MENIRKSHSKIVDQRDLELPPSWIDRSEKNDSVIFNNQGLVVISGTDRELSNRVISQLNSAKEMVVMCSFLLADKEIEDAIATTAKRGVRIYLMLASEARLENEPGEGNFEQKVVKQHKEMLKRLGGKVLIRSAPHFHAKVILVDPYTANANGFLLTANLTKEAIERNEELGVELTSIEIKEAAEYLRWAIWESSDHEILDSKNFNSVKPLNTVDYPKAINESVFFTTPQSTALKSKLLEVIMGAKSRIVISSFGWEENHDVVTALSNKANKGIKVTVLARLRNTAMPALIQLQNAGVEVLGFEWLHVKSIWTDKNEALVMSANIENHGLETGFEIGVFLTDDRQVLVFNALNHWMSKAPKMLLSNPKVGDVMGHIRIWKDGKLNNIVIAKESTVTLKSIDVPSDKSIDKEPKFPSLNWVEHPYHQIKYEWINIAPATKNIKEA
jgi:cardiolipin synthase